MKIFLILEYNKDSGGNVWADVQAYTSESERNDAFMPYQGKDADKIDVEVTKRPYHKKEQAANVTQPNS